jgi:hypothetical protein
MLTRLAIAALLAAATGCAGLVPPGDDGPPGRRCPVQNGHTLELQGAGGGTVITVLVANHTRRPCVVSEDVTIRIDGPAPVTGSPDTYNLDIRLPSRSRTSISWMWRNWCADGSPSVIIETGSASLGSGGTAPRCQALGEPSNLELLPDLSGRVAKL